MIFVYFDFEYVIFVMFLNFQIEVWNFIQRCLKVQGLFKKWEL